MKLREFFQFCKYAYKLKSASIIKPKYVDEEIIISLTTIKSRLPYLHLVIKSLKRQSVQPQKIILWIEHNLVEDIPKSLKVLSDTLFEIRFTNSSESHRKLVCTLNLFSEKAIVTCDDDVIYPFDWLERLLKDSIKFPHCVIAHECRYIGYDKNLNVTPYKKWRHVKAGQINKANIAIGWGGVLYPKGALPKEVMNQELYLTLAPKADDLWFKAMTAINGICVMKSTQSSPQPIPIPFTQRKSLKKQNITRDYNTQQWNNLCDHYENLKECTTDTKYSL